MTGGPANMSSELGAEFSAWDEYITGRNLELVPGERIVQSWRTTKFPEEHEDSILTVTLEERDDGTLLTLSHSNVPEGHVGYEQGGWQQYYFDP
jgi:Activator of HSP90 ATPase